MKPMHKRAPTTIAGQVERAMQLRADAREVERTEARLADEAAEEREHLLFGPRNVFKAGDVVVLTATACRIWATVMGFPVTRSLTAVWTVTACDCELCTHGSFVCTDEPIELELGYVSNDNVGTAALRHISVGQLKRKGELRADDGLWFERAEARKRFMDLCDEPHPDAELCGDALRRCVELHAEPEETRVMKVAVKKSTAKKPPPLPARRARAAPPIVAPAPANPNNAAPAAEWVAPHSLKPWAKNPRLNEHAVAKVVESIRRFGFAAPIVARKATHEIIAGHTRWKAAQQLKLDRVPVRFIDISEKDAHLLALADNRLGEVADWEVPELHELLSGYDLEDTTLAGWDEADVAKLGPDEDDDADGGVASGNGKKDDNHCPHCGRYMSAKMKAAHRST